MPRLDVDEIVAAVARYAGATRGEWQTNLNTKDDDQTDCVVGVPESVDPETGAWGAYRQVAEMSVFYGDERDFADVALATDAKRNAALVEVLAKALEEILSLPGGENCSYAHALATPAFAQYQAARSGATDVSGQSET